jgi:hypothetical protein
MNDTTEILPLALATANPDGETVAPSAGTLIEFQPRVDYEITPVGDLKLTRHADPAATNFVRRDCVLAFLDRLADAMNPQGAA